MPNDPSPIRRSARPDQVAEPAPAPRRSVMRRQQASGGGIADVNRTILQQGSAGRSEGGLWGRATQRMAVQGEEQNPGASLGMAVDASSLFGGDTAQGATGSMDISPEVAAEVVGQQYQVAQGAPIAPAPMVAQGIHEDGMKRPYVPFSPPPARVLSPLATSPKIRAEGADTADLDTLAAGQHLAHALQTEMGPAQAGVMVSDIGRSTRLDLMIDREMRAESRLHYG